MTIIKKDNKKDSKEVKLAVQSEQDLNELSRELRGLKRELRKRTIQLLEASMAQGEEEAERQRLKQLLQAAEIRTEKVQKTLSFRLGYELIHRSKSLQGLASLPKALWEISQEATRRRNGVSKLEQIRKRGRRAFRNLRSSRVKSSRVKEEWGSTTITKLLDSILNNRSVIDNFVAPHIIDSAAGLHSLRMACIMDEFTFSSFVPECDLLLLSPENWQEELEEFKPQILFVESAWRGKEDEWSGKVGHISSELRGIVHWCQKKEKIPTLFWCKEDPVHFSTFMNTAALFDFVFTTDIDCIHRYQSILGHERVYLLPFACQPKTQNPIEKYERKEAACFAGAYYTRYPERQRDFLRMLLKLLEYCPVEIYDRNYGKDDSTYQFPESYQSLIQGSLDFSEIDKAYKGYRYAININSIKYSQSMFARRVFEVLASNTVTVSNFSRGIQLLFGDLVLATDDAEILGSRLHPLVENEEYYRKFSLLGLRKVLFEHTYQDRLSYIVSKVFRTAPLRLLPKILVIAFAKKEQDIKTVETAFALQSYPHARLLIVSTQKPDKSKSSESRLGWDCSRKLCISELMEKEELYVAYFSSDDYYGEDYLMDLALATRYSESLIIGKGAFFCLDSSGLVLKHDGLQYGSVPSIPSRRALVHTERLSKVLVEELQTTSFDEDILGIDEFNYCEGAGLVPQESMERVSVKGSDLNLGMPMSALYEDAEQIKVRSTSLETKHKVLGPQEFRSRFKSGQKDLISVEHQTGGMLIRSNLEFKMSEYLYGTDETRLADFNFSTTARFYLEVSFGPTIQIVFIFFDSDKKRIGHTIQSSSTNHEIEVPVGAHWVRLGFLVSGSGQVLIRRLVFGNIFDPEPISIVGRSKTLLVTNNYPSATNLYKNAFVHRRVLKYQEKGVTLEIFEICPGELLCYREYQGVSIMSGDKEFLKRLLSSHLYENILVHFLNRDAWNVISPYLDEIQLLVWVHGFEIQMWHRRKFNYLTEIDQKNAQKLGKRRQDFWHEVLGEPHQNLKIIFVSKHLRDEVQADMRLSIPESQVEVIHNLIDGELFRYEVKPEVQRTQILSIRPYTNRTYANDLSVQAIVALSEKEFFDELDFRIIGDGVLFEKTVAPLRKFKNVLIEKRFLSQPEIAELHKEYGVFLVPSRLDSQGVSRDEAMASGLVPITNSVAAISEFLDATCGFLVPAEDAQGLADAIESLYQDPKLFTTLSANAAARVRNQSGVDQTIMRELSLMRKVTE